MVQIGLIGGIGPAAQDFYVRRLIRLFADAGAPLDMTIVHADAPTVLANLAADRRTEQATIFAGLAKRLAKAGTDFVAVTSIAGHFCRREFENLSPLPIIDMIDAVALDIAARKLATVGILGTRTVMETRFFGAINAATVLAPLDSELGAVHSAYAAMASSGSITPEQRSIFHQAAQRMIDRGAAAIMLGGTDLTLAFNANDGLPLIDCAAIHVDAIAARVLRSRADVA